MGLPWSVVNPNQSVVQRLIIPADTHVILQVAEMNWKSAHVGPTDEISSRPDSFYHGKGWHTYFLESEFCLGFADVADGAKSSFER